MLWIEIVILALLFVLICLFVYSYIKITNKLAEILLYVKENYVSKKPADNSRNIKVTLFGVQYKSIDEASNALGIPRSNLSRWWKNKDIKEVEKLVKDYQKGIKNNPVAPSKFIIDYITDPFTIFIIVFTYNDFIKSFIQHPRSPFFYILVFILRYTY